MGGSQSRPDAHLRLTVGGLEVFVAASEVDHVSLPLEIVPVPGSADLILGVVQSRGEILPVADLARWLDSPDTSGDHLVVLRSGGHRVAVPVDRVHDFEPTTEDSRVLDTEGLLASLL